MIEKVWGYRKARVLGKKLRIELNREQVIAFEEMLGEDVFDNHIVVKFKGLPMYFWFTDNVLIVGTEIKEGKY